MARFCGVIGYAETVETGPDIFTEQITERQYYGDVVRNSRRYSTGDQVNGAININNSISIVADGYAYQNIFAIRYVTWMGVRWVVTDAEVQRPRLILTLGGEYNGPTS